MNVNAKHAILISSAVGVIGGIAIASLFNKSTDKMVLEINKIKEEKEIEKPSYGCKGDTISVDELNKSWQKVSEKKFETDHSEDRKSINNVNKKQDESDSKSATDNTKTTKTIKINDMDDSSFVQIRYVECDKLASIVNNIGTAVYNYYYTLFKNVLLNNSYHTNAENINHVEEPLLKAFSKVDLNFNCFNDLKECEQAMKRLRVLQDNIKGFYSGDPILIPASMKINVTHDYSDATVATVQAKPMDPNNYTTIRSNNESGNVQVSQYDTSISDIEKPKDNFES